MNQKQLLNMLRNREFIVTTLAAIISIITLGQFHSVNAELQPGTNYIIYANGHSIGNSLKYTLELQILTGTGSSNKIPIYLVEGLIVHDNQDFITSSNWKGTLLKNDGLMMLSGNATTYDGTQLSMILFGKLVNNTKDGAYYKLVGRLTHEKQSMLLTQVTEIVNVHSLTQKQIYKEMPHIFFNQHKDLQKLEVQPIKKADAITVIVKHPDRAYIHNYVYSITAKVYLLKENPRKDFDLHGGEVQGAHVTIDIINQNGEIVKSFDGITDKLGYFSDLFIMPDNFVAGTYVVHVTAEKDEINDTDDGILHVFYLPLGEGVKTKSVVPIPTSNLSISITSPTDGSTLGISSFVIYGTAYGASLSSVSVTVDGTPVAVTGIVSWSAPSGVLVNGIHTIIATAHNRTNIASQTVHVTVSTGSTTIHDIQQLINLKESMNLDNGITNSLDVKLNAAISSFNSGNNNAVKNQLNAFINEVNAQTGKKITQAQAIQLIQNTQNIINSIH